jgi:hypothetical protein
MYQLVEIGYLKQGNLIERMGVCKAQIQDYQGNQKRKEIFLQHIFVIETNLVNYRERRKGVNHLRQGYGGQRA